MLKTRPVNFQGQVVLAKRRDASLAEIPWPPDGLEDVERCPVCASKRRRLLHDELIDRVFFCAPGRWKMYRCDDCVSGYLDPRPSKETIGLAYTDYYTHRIQKAAPPPRQQFAAGIRARLRRGYSNQRYGTKFAPASRLGLLAGFVWPQMRRVIDRQNYYISNRPRRVLEVGFGGGAFLEHARNNGWEAVGVDIDPKVVELARRRGFHVFQGGIDTVLARGERFDAVAMSHVIEHVPDPVSVLAAAHEILNPGGMIYIDTPNLNAAGHTAFEKYWLGLDAPRHLVVFTWDSMEFALRRVGFEDFRRQRRTELMEQVWRASELVRLGVPLNSPAAHSQPLTAPKRALPRFRMSEQEFVTLTARKA